MTTPHDPNTVRTEGLMMHDCLDCHQPFEVSAHAAQWYYDRGWDVPRRCFSCRETRRRTQTNGPGGGPPKEPTRADGKRPAHPRHTKGMTR